MAALTENAIPRRLVGILADIFSEHYTHSEINRHFLYANAPGEPPDGNKVNKTVDWLLRSNKESPDPLKILGPLLEDFMERELFDPDDREYREPDDEPIWSAKLRSDRTKLEKELSRCGILYSGRGIVIKTGTSASELSHRQLVSEGGLSAVQIELDRATSGISSDPNGAIHYAANILEAVFKAYLDRKAIPFNDERTNIPDLWMKVRHDIGLKPQDLGSNDLKKIAGGLNSIVDGSANIRNKKSGAHGRTEQQNQSNQLRPRHARLVVGSAGIIANYVLECLNE